MTTKNMNLGYKGDFCEQTAELATACGNREIADRNYRRAIESYQIGGFTEEALRVARKINDIPKIKELEEMLKQFAPGDKI